MEVEQREVSGMALAWSRTARLQAHAPRMQGYKVKGFSQIRSQWHRQGWLGRYQGSGVGGASVLSSLYPR